MKIKYKSLDRRTVIKGIGTSIALPFLDCMVPHSAFSAEDMPKAVMFNYHPLGWSIRKKPVIDPLKVLAKSGVDVTWLKNVTHNGGQPGPEGPGAHARSAGSYLNGDRVIRGKKITKISIDQLIASKYTGVTPFQSLIFGSESKFGADSGLDANYKNLSWGNNSPKPPISDPQKLFNLIFSDIKKSTGKKMAGGGGADQESLALKNLLDRSLSDYKGLRKQLGKADQIKLDQHLEAIDELQKRINFVKKDTAMCSLDPKFKASASKDYVERLHSFFDIAVLALECDLTRVMVMTFAQGASKLKFNQYVPGANREYHDLSHYRRSSTEKPFTGIVDFMYKNFGVLLEKMSKSNSQIKLLDKTIVTFGSGLNDPEAHNAENVPLFMAGPKNLFKAGVKNMPKGTVIADVWLGVAHSMGHTDIKTLGRYGKKPFKF